MGNRIVFHLDWDDEKPVEMALHNINNILHQKQVNPTDIYVVANGPAVKLFIASRVYSYFHKVEALYDIGVQFALCELALGNFSVQRENVLSFCSVVPSGVVKIVELQNEGYAYIKP